MIKFLTILLLSLISFSILVLAMHGKGGNPTELEINTTYWKENGPFELSPERGRFSLAYSIVENKSLQFSTALAKFTTPDVAYSDGNYVTLFPPGVSYMIIPGYILGRFLGVSQVGAFGMISFFAILNMLIIRAIVGKISGSYLAGTIAGLIFLFATPAFPYAVTLYQHHVTTFIVLLSTYLLIRSTSLLSLGVVLFLCALSVPIDNPNAIFLMPVGLYSLSKLVSWERTAEKLKVRFRYLGIFSLIFATIPMLMLFTFNLFSHKEPFKLSGTLAAVKAVDDVGRPVQNTQTQEVIDITALEEQAESKSATGFFKTRNMLNGVYTHLFSLDRGTLFYTPVVFFGFLGLAKFPKKYREIKAVMAATLAFIFLLYSLWGDPWGGWAFGGRYMIPAYALLCVFLGVSLQTITKKYVIALVFLCTILYSLSVNTLGAVTTNANPPATEASALEKISGKIERYSYDRNWYYLLSSGSKSYVYQTYLTRYLSPRDFYISLVVANSSLISVLYFYFLYKVKTGKI